ncbi:ATP-binding protein [Amycolatopsis sp. H20-H5]|uniref:ATP-binding protein n=1 Tax=Amycolatopsis sp. H20-H5 TaxID=3046309 RepID=UPI002DBD0533|nr:ATP-binding protein [Amycolatopsis sp. H20-H5]MEC3982130.1 ATP-binding protein [Amycolatopsis sp. H20-H5]
MTTHTTQVDDLQLVAQPSALPCTELFVRLILMDWSLLPMLAQVTATAGRLVGAVVDASSAAAPAFITVRLRLQGEMLVIEVDDDLPDLAPPRSTPGERTGVDRHAPHGRTTWCELPLPGGLTAGQVRLPRREGRRTLVDEPVSGAPVAADPAVLERLLTRLSGWSE